MTYESPYGRADGLGARLRDWADRLPRDTGYPWVGTGLLEDLKLAAKFLSGREMLESMRVNGDPESSDHARALLRDLDTLEAAEDAAARIRSLPGEPYRLDPVETIERLDEGYQAVRGVLVNCGALAPGDKDTPIADLLRALLS